MHFRSILVLPLSQLEGMSARDKSKSCHLLQHIAGDINSPPNKTDVAFLPLGKISHWHRLGWRVVQELRRAVQPWLWQVGLVEGDRQGTSPLCLESSPTLLPASSLFTRPARSHPPGLSYHITSSEKPSLITSDVPPHSLYWFSPQNKHNLKWRALLFLLGWPAPGGL